MHNFRGQPVVLVFSPADWEPVSTAQLRRCNDVLPEIRSLGAELVGVSADSVWCHQPFMRDLGLEFRLLSDFHPQGGAARAYGVYRPRQGTSGRALFVVDAAGVIQWHYLGTLRDAPHPLQKRCPSCGHVNPPDARMNNAYVSAPFVSSASARLRRERRARGRQSEYAGESSG